MRNLLLTVTAMSLCLCTLFSTDLLASNRKIAAKSAVATAEVKKPAKIPGRITRRLHKEKRIARQKRVAEMQNKEVTAQPDTELPAAAEPTQN
jgi:hypothetical protein